MYIIQTWVWFLVRLYLVIQTCPQNYGSVLGRPPPPFLNEEDRITNYLILLFFILRMYKVFFPLRILLLIPLADSAVRSRGKGEKKIAKIIQVVYIREETDPP